MPKKQKAKILRKQALESLKQSTQSMSTCNRMLTQVVICGRRETQSQIVSQIVRGVVVPTFIVTRALQDAMAMRAASAKVHKITQSNLHCNCHFVHLRLDTQSIRALTAKVTPTERSEETKIFFRLTDKSKSIPQQTPSNTDSTGLEFFFTGSNCSTASAPSPVGICEGLVNSDATSSSLLPTSATPCCDSIPHPGGRNTGRGTQSNSFKVTVNQTCFSNQASLRTCGPLTYYSV